MTIASHGKPDVADLAVLKDSRVPDRENVTWKNIKGKISAIAVSMSLGRPVQSCEANFALQRVRCCTIMLSPTGA